MFVEDLLPELTTKSKQTNLTWKSATRRPVVGVVEVYTLQCSRLAAQHLALQAHYACTSSYRHCMVLPLLMRASGKRSCLRFCQQPCRSERCTMRFGSSIKVPAKCMPKYYRISQCVVGCRRWSQPSSSSARIMLAWSVAATPQQQAACSFAAKPARWPTARTTCPS